MRLEDCGLTIEPAAGEGAGRWRVLGRQRLEAPLDEVFAFFSDAANLQRITPPWLNFEVLTPDVEITEGARIDYRLKLHGVSLSWTSLIEGWNPPASFVDRQLRGPYRYWRHEHRFLADGAATICEDEVHYDVPGGALANRLLVAPDIRRIFGYRARKLAVYFNAGAPVEAKLPACSGSPNCAASLAGGARAPLPPLKFSGDASRAIERLRGIVAEMPGAEIVEARDDYMHAEFRTQMLRFVDDVEFAADRAAGAIHFVSQSRRGYYDFGVNLRRMREISERYRAARGDDVTNS